MHENTAWPVPVFYKEHPLGNSLANFWCPYPPLDGGINLFDIAGSLNGTLVGAPSWRNTAWGSGITTGNAKYVSFGTLQPSRNFSLFIAYTYRNDALTNETGILFSAGKNGVDLRHKTTNFEFLKSQVSSIKANVVTT